ncbi:hypothetical protein CDAR_607921 [Caerostris darwini]|uniref:Uncharacterized protein n=1 Tax=Caerostris darwini TaxID=1538125 RepID=A0AAV4UL66_9ARAC|nr:hypothetical protein CDAR_607921 [Caerostris darwini]
MHSAVTSLVRKSKQFNRKWIGGDRGSISLISRSNFGRYFPNSLQCDTQLQNLHVPARAPKKSFIFALEEPSLQQGKGWKFVQIRKQKSFDHIRDQCRVKKPDDKNFSYCNSPNFVETAHSNETIHDTYYPINSSKYTCPPLLFISLTCPNQNTLSHRRNHVGGECSSLMDPDFHGGHHSPLDGIGGGVENRTQE